MDREQVRQRIEDVGVIPAVRVSSPHDALFVAEAVSSGGIPIVEITMTVPGALDVVREMARSRTDVIVGAGTVLDEESAREALDAGAHFLTSTGYDEGMIRVAADAQVVVLPGVLTPTEVIRAWKAGCDFVKIFPCAQVGGASYIKALKTPLPRVRMIASGGVNQQTAAEFVLAGATALGVGGALVPASAIRQHQPHWISELARRFVHIVKEARSRKQEEPASVGA
ncbi:MAG: bifunctional 4-hydroxy-2-oxoglutarate aldolase/2-dehydro-3-deoxy-phosphogluconate aldolase [Acidobacteriaceae bacterium]|nr:bifunctional 4-hydroxy-2-oxoglutarate aldolase/2-dehydro-3-deoxy-phosphogluconate aldolase [Acidobacteriaceae bacterium]